VFNNWSQSAQRIAQRSQRCVPGLARFEIST
jgi:hypothetical protein